MIFLVDFLLTGRIHDYLHARFFSSFSLKNFKISFLKKSKTGLQGAREAK
jgi:hypothetical protein